MSNFNNQITLTQTSSGKTFDIGCGNIIRVTTNVASGSNVQYYDNGATVKQQIVNESAASIASASGTLIAVTDKNGIVNYINPIWIITFNKFFTPLTGSDITNTITAHAGGGQGSAVALTTEYNVVTVCATNGDSVKLEAAAAGVRQIVYNNTAHTLAIFPASGETINGGSANASVSILPGTQYIFTSDGVSNWTESAPVQSEIVYNATGATNKIIYTQEPVAILETLIAAVTTAPVEQANTYTSTTGITAHSGGGQASAVALTTEFNNVTTVAASADSVKLPSAAAGVRVIVKNNGANPLAVFPATGDTIDAGSANASVTLLVGEQRIFSAIDSTDWESNFYNASDATTVTTTITAHAGGGGSGSAVVLTGEFNNITVCATANDSVILPATGQVGQIFYVENNGAASANVYPNSGGTVNGAAPDAAIALPAGTRKVFVLVAANTWLTGTRLSTGKGTAALPAISFDAQPNMGIYWISSTQIGVSVSGALVGGFNASGLFTGAIAEQVAGAGITLANNLIKKNVLTALNTTGTVTAAMINKGGITSTSGAAVTATLDSIANIVAQTGAVAGTVVDFVVDNSGGSNTVTVAVSAGIVAAKQTSSGDTANDILLTVAASATVGVGMFSLYFISTSAAVLFRRA